MRMLVRNTITTVLVILLIFYMAACGKTNDDDKTKSKISTENKTEKITEKTEKETEKLTETVTEAVTEAVKETVTVIPTKAKLLFDYNVGDVITLGRCEQDDIESNGPEEIEWIILEKENDRALVISKYCIYYSCYLNKNLDGTPNNWEISDLRKNLNNDLYNNIFNDEEKKCIADSEVINGISDDIGIVGGANTLDKLYVFTRKEAEQYLNSESLLKTYPTVHLINNYYTPLSPLSGSIYILRDSSIETKTGFGVRGKDFTDRIYTNQTLFIRPVMRVSISELENNQQLLEKMKNRMITSNKVLPDYRKDYQVVALESAKVGDYIKCGAFEIDGDEENGKEAMIWRVVDKNNDKLLVVNCYILFSGMKNVTQQYADSDFISASFTDEEKSRLVSMNIDEKEYNFGNVESYIQTNYDTSSLNSRVVNTMEHRVFLPSKLEQEKYELDSDVSITPFAYMTGIYSTKMSYWLRDYSIIDGKSDIMDNKSICKEFEAENVATSGFRPMMWIKQN